MNTLLHALLFTGSLCVASGATNSTLRLRGRTLQLATASSSEITGPFDIVTMARFNDVPNGSHQRVFDFGNGEAKDNVWLGQVWNSKDMAFEVLNDGKFTRCTAPGAIVQGELATWRVGVDQNGLQWIEKNGHRICSTQGQVPKNVFRASKLLGQSNWRADSAMKGAVIGIDVTNVGEVRDDGLLNRPEQIRGPFEISVQARFDDPQGGHWQRVFDFGNGPEQDNIFFGQIGNSNDIIFTVFRDRKSYDLVVPGAIVTGQLDHWKVGIDANGIMWIEKAGKRIASKQAVVPANIQRNNLLIGSSNWAVDAPLDGVVLALRVSQVKPTTWDITGPFDIVTAAKFNDLPNGWYQRVFDFGNGEAKDNVWLGQVGNTNDMAFELVIDGKYTRCTAPGALVQGELATWKVGVDQNGFQWMDKNDRRICSIQGQVPRNVIRASKLLGQSNWRADSAMKGAVIGIDLTNAGEDREDGLLNKPDQIRGPFEISVQARFDDPQGGHWQRIFDFGNGFGKDNILFGQYANTNDISFFIFQDNIVYELTAKGAIVTGQLASWKVGVNANGLMYIEKAGIRIAEKQGVVPKNIPRNNLLLGASNWPENAPLDGVVLALRVLPAKK